MGRELELCTKASRGESLAWESGGLSWYRSSGFTASDHNDNLTSLTLALYGALVQSAVGRSVEKGYALRCGDDLSAGRCGHRSFAVVSEPFSGGIFSGGSTHCGRA